MGVRNFAYSIHVYLQYIMCIGDLLYIKTHKRGALATRFLQNGWRFVTSCGASIGPIVCKYDECTVFVMPQATARATCTLSYRHTVENSTLFDIGGLQYSNLTFYIPTFYS